MTKSLSARVLVALDQPEIPQHVRVRVHNLICGPNAADPPSVAWQVLIMEVQHLMRVMSSNKLAVRYHVKEAWHEYYDTISALPAVMREARDRGEELTRDKQDWQAWVPKEQRLALELEFESIYAQYPVRGGKIVPFAPLAYRHKNKQRVENCKTAIASLRRSWHVHARGANTWQGAVILTGCEQAMSQIIKYEGRLKRGAHPYEDKAKVFWQNYCDTDVATLLRTLNRDPSFNAFDKKKYEFFYDKDAASELARKQAGY